MPTIPPGSIVEFRSWATPELRYPPAGQGSVVVAVETAALRSRRNALTTVMTVEGDQVTWVGSVDESMVQVIEGAFADARAALTELVLKGDALWQIVRPGTLRVPGVHRRDTVYQGDRPWTVIGGPHDCGVLAVPLNDLEGGIRGHYQCEVLEEYLLFPGSKDSKLELNHVWSFPAGLTSSPEGTSIDEQAWPALVRGVKGYYPGRR